MPTTLITPSPESTDQARNPVSSRNRVPSSLTTVLLVDDNPVERRLTGALLEKSKNFHVRYAVNGADALAQLEQQAPHVVLTDLIMPEMNGLELVEAIRCRYPLIPVILMTAHGNEEIAIQALQKGAACYVPKKNLGDEIGATLQRVVAAAKADHDQHQALECLTQLDSHYELENDRALVPPLVAQIQQDLTRLRLCDETARTRIGLALEEAILNALYHGNLELDPQMRRTARAEYDRQAEERRRLPPYADRRIRIRACLSRAQAVYTVSDEGPGFDPSKLPNPMDPANLGKLTARGLLLIRTFMDEVTFNAAGNEITLIKRRDGGGR